MEIFNIHSNTEIQSLENNHCENGLYCINYIQSHFFCDDIWKIIIEYIMSSHYCIKCTISYYDNWQIKKYSRKLHRLKCVSSLNKLLITSKMFQKILNTNLFSIDNWRENSGNITYSFSGKYKICIDCYEQEENCTCSVFTQYVYNI